MKSHIIVAASFLTLHFPLTVHSQISEIMSLKDGESINPNLYQKYSVNQIAESAVQRLHITREKNSGGDLNYFDQSEIILGFSSGNLASIIESKEFLNAHQVKLGATFNDDLRHRSDLEDSLIGFKLGNGENANSLRPKYAYLVPKNLYGHPQTTFNPNYGNILAVLKNKLKNRSTFSIGDSMEAGKDSLHTFKFKDQIKLKSEISEISYWEAQIWGKLKLSDIDAFLVNCEGFPKISLSAIKLMLSQGFNVYNCELDKNKRNIKRGSKVTTANLNQNLYLSQEDIISPEIKNLNFNLTPSQQIKVSFEVTDDVGINYCLLHVLKNNKIIFGDEISIRDINTKKTQCEFLVDKVQLPIEFKIYVRDWYNNQSTLFKNVEKI